MASKDIVAFAALFALGCGACEQQDRDVSGWVYFISERGEHRAVYRVRADGNAEQKISKVDTDAYVYGVSPDGKKITMVLGHDAEHDIFTAEPDGTSMAAVAESPGIDWYPRYSPDGQWILFESGREAFRELYRVSVEGGDVQRLTNNPEGNFDGAWSPDGKQVAFVSSRAQQLDLYVMNADGTSQVRLTTHPGDSIKPDWVSDNRRIAFISGRDDVDALFVIDTDGKNLRKISCAECGKVESFSAHPTKNLIIYTTRDQKRRGALHIVDVDSGESETVSGNSDNDSDAMWSPDGRYVAFSSKVDGRSNIWRMRADGSGRTRLTNDPIAAWLPRWFNLSEERKAAK